MWLNYTVLLIFILLVKGQEWTFLGSTLCHVYTIGDVSAECAQRLASSGYELGNQCAALGYPRPAQQSAQTLPTTPELNICASLGESFQNILTLHYTFVSRGCMCVPILCGNTLFSGDFQDYKLVITGFGTPNEVSINERLCPVINAVNKNLDCASSLPVSTPGQMNDLQELNPLFGACPGDYEFAAQQAGYQYACLPSRTRSILIGNNCYELCLGQHGADETNACFGGYNDQNIGEINSCESNYETYQGGCAENGWSGKRGYDVIPGIASGCTSYGIEFTTAPNQPGATCNQNPVTEAPVTLAPFTKRPSTSAPVTKRPVTSVPITKRPSTLAPVTKMPSTSAPVTKRPITSAPVTKRPSTSAPFTKRPSTSAPVTKMPSTSAPVTEMPSTSAPVTEMPSTSAPVTQSPVPVATNSPVTSTPVEPATTSPVTSAPVDSPTSLPDPLECNQGTDLEVVECLKQNLGALQQRLGEANNQITEIQSMKQACDAVNSKLTGVCGSG